MSAFVKYLKEYGIKCTIAMLLFRLFKKNKSNSNIKNAITQYKHKVIYDYIMSYYSDKFDIKKTNTGDKLEGCIWTAWLQGEENAPEVIQLTIASMRKHANGHRVVVLTNDNVDDYIEIPSIIKTKHSNGIMGHAHYSDVIRIMILAKYGGVWLDATIFINTPIDEKAFVSPFYSIGFSSNKKSEYVSDHKWIVVILGGCKQSIYLYDIAHMLTSYWEEHIIPIDYFVFDYIISALYSRNIDFHDIVDSLEKQKRFTYELSLIINEPFNDNIMNGLVSQNCFYSLSYKKNYIKKTKEGSLTNYGYLYDQYLSCTQEEIKR